MAIVPKSAYGTLLQRGDGAGPEVFTTVDGVRSISGPNQSIETIDVTHHTSASDYREIIPSFISAGEISFELIYDSSDAQHNGLLDDFQARVRRNFKITLPDDGAEVLAFAAYITGFEYMASIDDAVKVNVTLSIDGEITVS